jgi:hypothetical protein
MNGSHPKISAVAQLLEAVSDDSVRSIEVEEDLNDVGGFCLSPRKGSIQILDSPAIRGKFG